MTAVKQPSIYQQYSPEEASLKATFTFLGARHFHLCEARDNEFAVWSDLQA